MNTIEQFRGRMISPKTCAEMLDGSEHTIHRWIKEGKIQAVKIGYRMTRVDGGSLADFLAARAIAAGAMSSLPDSSADAGKGNRPQSRWRDAQRLIGASHGDK